MSKPLLILTDKQLKERMPPIYMMRTELEEERLEKNNLITSVGSTNVASFSYVKSLKYIGKNLLKRTVN